MKKHLFLLPLILSLASVAYGQAPLAVPPGPNDVAINPSGIKPSGILTPQYDLGVGPQKRSPSLTWLEIEVEYSTVPPLIDELTFEYSVLLNGQLLIGSSTYVNIPRSKEHYAVVYISPGSLNSVMNGQLFTSAKIGDIQVRITRQGQELAIGATKPGALPNVPQRTGMILNKPETPFAPLFWDRYETLKPASH